MAQYIVLAGNESEILRELLTALGRPDLLDIAAGEPGAGTEAADRFLHRNFQTKTRAEWEAFLEPIDLCWAPVRSLKDGFEDPQQRRAADAAARRPGNPHIGPAIKFENDPAKPGLELPDYGQTNTEWKAR